MRFLVMGLVSGLMLFNFPGCSTDVVDEIGGGSAAAKEITDFITSLEKENGIVIKTGVLAPLGTLVEELIKADNKDDTAAVTTKIKAKVDELAVTSEEVKKEATKIQTAAVAYVTKTKKVANELALTKAIETLEEKATALTTATTAMTAAINALTADTTDVTEAIVGLVGLVGTAATAVVAAEVVATAAAMTAKKATTQAPTVATESKATEDAAKAAIVAIITSIKKPAALTEAAKVVAAEGKLTAAIAAFKLAATPTVGS